MDIIFFQIFLHNANPGQSAGQSRENLLQKNKKSDALHIQGENYFIGSVLLSTKR